MEPNGYRLNEVYTIVEEIGSGGGGVVYKAYHERLKTYVVLKKIKENVKGILESRAEADILKNIKHTYLPRVYDFLEIDGDIFTVMDYIPGVNLKEALEKTPSFPPKQVLKWAVQLSEALDYLHGQNPPVIHSDIKPANIMLTPEGNICLIDFNISLAFDRSMRTSTGTSAGYSPPEQYGTRNSYYKTVTREREKTSGASGVGDMRKSPEVAGRIEAKAETFFAGGRRSEPFQADSAEPFAVDDTGPFAADDTEQYAVDDTEPFAADDTEQYAVDDTEPFAADDTEPFTVDDTEPFAADDTEPFAVDDTEPFAVGDTEPFTADNTESSSAESTDSFPSAGTARSVSEHAKPFSAGRRGEARSAGAEPSDPASREIPGLDILIGHGVDERSDVYSLGATLYHLLTGQKPAADFTAVLPIGTLKPDLSEGFAHIIEKMMELKPENRYQNGSGLLYAFRHIYELDHEYQRYKNRRRTKKAVAAALYLLGALCLFVGMNVRGRELHAEYNRYVEAASEAVKAGDFKAAQAAAGNALALNPSRVEAYSAETLRLYSEGDYDGCIRYGRDAINSPAYTVETEAERRSLGDIYYVVGNAYFEKTDYANAGVCIKTAIDYNHSNSLYYRDYAIVQAKTGRTDEAEKALKTAMLLKLGEDSIYMVQGEIAYSKGEYEKAAQTLEKCISLAKEKDLKRRAVILCSDAYQGMEDAGTEAEIALLQRAEGSFSPQIPMSITERLGDALARAARAAGERGDLGSAARYYALALEKFDGLYRKGYETRQMMENLAILYQQMGNFPEAEAMMLRMTEQYPEDYRGYKRLAFLEADKQQQKENKDRDYRAAKEYYEKADRLYRDRMKPGQEDMTETDPEMEMLGNLMRDLEDGGWF